jgi:plasmid stabilization system protein ParE
MKKPPNPICFKAGPKPVRVRRYEDRKVHSPLRAGGGGAASGASEEAEVETGEGFYQSTRKVWAEVIKIAKLPSVTPHTLRHTLGSTATSSGEALALTGAILGHANLRSTAIYAHVQHDPSLEAAKRVEKLLATALDGRAARAKDGDSADDVPELDADLIRVLAERLSKEGSDAARLRAIIAQVIALNT